VIRHRVGDVVVVHSIHVYPAPWLLAGCATYRYRYLSNPRGVDWSGFLALAEDIPLLSRGVARVDPTVRTLLP
jgi:hypothetical protein